MTTLKSVQQIISEQIGTAEDEIKPESLLDDLGLDSLDKVEVVMALEDVININIEDEIAEKWETIQDIISYIDQLKGTQG
jgi:acyl carrier protein